MSEYPESNYIYVELIATQMYRDMHSLSRYAGKKPEVVVRKKIKRTGNSFSGYIPVPEGLSTERCILRAYSYWMLNRSVEYMYSKSLRITNPMKDDLMKRLSKEKIRDRDLYLQLNADYNEPEKETRTRYDVQFLPEGGRYLPGVGSAVWTRA